jgi:F0F1-type ATP synthase membrane subunit b/b'
VSLFASGSDTPDAEALLRRVIEIISNAKSMPLSTTVRIERDEVLELLEEASNRLPDELRQARWMLKERTEYLEKVKREADDILEAARVRAERMVQRTEIVREAQHNAQHTLESAREDARRLRLEAEDYCDQKLASFEIILDKTIKTVQAGREKLQAVPLASADGGDGPGPDEEDEFFDQDRR